MIIINKKYVIPSKHNIWDPEGPHLGFYMGPIWAPHVGPTCVLQPGNMRDPCGLAIWAIYGPNMGPICKSRWRIYNAFLCCQTVIWTSLMYKEGSAGFAKEEKK